MTARLEFIAQSGEELVQMSLDTFSKSCLLPVQSHDLILNCLRTKVGSSNSVKDHQEKKPGKPPLSQGNPQLRRCPYAFHCMDAPTD